MASSTSRGNGSDAQEAQDSRPMVPPNYTGPFASILTNFVTDYEEIKGMRPAEFIVWANSTLDKNLAASTVPSFTSLDLNAAQSITLSDNSKFSRFLRGLNGWHFRAIRSTPRGNLNYATLLGSADNDVLSWWLLRLGEEPSLCGYHCQTMAYRILELEDDLSMERLDEMELELRELEQTFG